MNNNIRSIIEDEVYNSTWWNLYHMVEWESFKSISKLSIVSSYDCFNNVNQIIYEI